MLLNNSTLNSVTETKFLGLWIQENLKWTSHITNLTAKLNKCSYALRILSGSTSLNVSRTAYFANFHSILTYGIIFWGNSPEGLAVFRIQKRTLRSLVGARTMESCKPIFKRLKIMPLPCVYIYQVLVFVWTSLVSSDSFRRNHLIHNHNTRQRDNLHVISTKTSLCKSGVLHSGTVLFNNLPSTMKNIESKKLFKRELKTYLLLNNFYSVHDYLKSTIK